MVIWYLCVLFFNLTTNAAQIQCNQQFDISYPLYIVFRPYFTKPKKWDKSGSKLLGWIELI